MDAATVILVIILLLAFAALVAYFLKDYYDYRTNVDTHLTKVDSDISNTSSLGNLKYVVDQANTSFNSIGTNFYGYSNQTNSSLSSLTSSLGTTNTNLTNLNNNYNIATSNINTFNTNFDRSFKIAGTIDDPLQPQTVANNYRFNFPTSPANIDTRLISHVTAVGGLTIRDLNSTASTNQQVKICGTGATAKCVQLPDVDGNTYLAPLNPSATNGIILDSVNGDVKVYGQSLQVGISTSSPAASGVTKIVPLAAGGIKITVGGTDVFSIDKDGAVKSKGILTQSATSF